MSNTEEYLKNFSLTIKNLRQSSKFTQKEVADKLGITYQSYQAYERGKALPSLPVFISIAEVYDVSLDYLIGKKEY
ncbi:MAG TPA: XRE family transcriptional regulator [Clostridiales bacterium]|nr:XRE family transcriptional regulator [Clostridiales bacterium]